jgi:L-ascorbate metabolism protein UlaG (beta-lactamase superfamily)
MSGLDVRYLGWSGFQFMKDGSGVVIDPLDKRSGDVDCDVVYCTHNHPDHVGGIATFMDRNPEAVLVANQQVTDSYRRYSDRTVVAEDGALYRHGEWEFQFIAAKHGFLDALNLGVVIRNGGDSFGHCGDAVDFSGFASIQLDTLAVPITGMFTASPTRALSELKRFDHPLPTIVWMHWVFRDPHRFSERLSTMFPRARCIVPVKGELIPI